MYTNDAIKKAGIIPVIKLTNPEKHALSLARTLLDGGINVMEITFRARGADKAISLISDHFPDILVGAGTVLDKEQIDCAKNAGAKFIVTPGMDPSLVDYCKKLSLPIYPGCTTSTDYQTAYRLGLSIVKFFPAEQSGGLAKIKALHGPFPALEVMPTGGISLDNLAEYLSCPYVAACGGSFMVPSVLIEGERWDEITALCKKAVAIVEEVRKNA